MNQKQQNLAAVIRKSHHLARAELWAKHAAGSLVVGAPVFICGIAFDSQSQAGAGYVLLVASWVSYRVARFHMQKAARQCS